MATRARGANFDPNDPMTWNAPAAGEGDDEAFFQEMGAPVEDLMQLSDEQLGQLLGQEGVQVPIMIVLALLMATLLNNPDLKFRGLLRTAIFLPCVTSLVAYAILFKSMFALDGVVNQTLIGLYLIDQPIPWLSDPFWAKVLVIIGITWRWTGV